MRKMIIKLLYGLIKASIYVRLKLYKYEFLEEDVIDSIIPNHDLYVKSDNINSVYITGIHLKRFYIPYTITLDGGYEITCADDHKLLCGGGLKHAYDIKVKDYVYTKNGPRAVRSIKKGSYPIPMFDITVSSNDHLYLANDIVNHNSIMSAVYIVWYIINNSARNILCTSQNSDKVKELMDKIYRIIKGLPMYLKPGMVEDNKMIKYFDNDCKLVAQTTTENAGASFTAHVFYCDEFALVDARYLEEFFRTVYPALSQSVISQMIITSTPRGINKFYELYNKAISGENPFNPIRVDWFEVPLLDENGDPVRDENGNLVYRDEKWKSEQVAVIGEEGFNQEFACMFLAGNKLLLSSKYLKRLKSYQTNYIHHTIGALDELDIDYEDLMWHPRFDMDCLVDPGCEFAISIDLGEGVGSDYSVLSIHQILPMSIKECDELSEYSTEKDFFKLVQVGILRSNYMDVPAVATFFYYLVTRCMLQDHTTITLELNHDGNWFRSTALNVDGEDNEMMEDIFVEYQVNLTADENETRLKKGLTQNASSKMLGIKKFRQRIRNFQLMPTEYGTIEEALSFTRNKNGKFESQTGHDDNLLCELNITHLYDTPQYDEQCSYLLQFCNEEFIKKLEEKLGRKIYIDSKSDETDEFNGYMEDRDIDSEFDDYLNDLGIS